jgi:hypothetical protein
MFLDLRFLLDFLLGWLARPTVKTPEPGARSLSVQGRPPPALIASICSSVGKHLARWRSG